MTEQVHADVDLTTIGMPATPDRLGQKLEDARLITPEQSRTIASYSKSNGMRFGEAAVALGYIDRNTLEEALSDQYGMYTADQNWEGEPVAFTQPHSPQAEDYRTIRNALALRWFKHPQGARTLSVISPDRREGRSVMAANLAVCFAQVGFRTLLVDADMRNPIQHKMFNLDDAEAGLSAYLAERVPQPRYQVINSLPTLSVMTVGGIPPNPQELLLRKALDRLVSETVQRFEMVIFDTPAASVGADYQIIGAAAQGALMVTQQAKTKTRTAKRLVEQCSGFGIRIVGSAMLNHS